MKVLYLHIPKTGGTSITKALRDHPNNVITEQHPVYKKNPKYHHKYHDVINFNLSRADHFKNVLGQNAFAKLWKVAIVRNPWDRYVSNWKWLTRRESLYPKKGWSARGWSGEDGHIEFADFVKQTRPIHTERFKKMNSGYQHDQWHLLDQIKHIVDKNGNILIDHIGRFENLQSEFDLICNKSNLNLELPHVNRVGHYSGEAVEHPPVKIHYSEYYNQELVDIVASRCKADIEAFNYDYEEKK